MSVSRAREIFNVILREEGKAAYREEQRLKLEEDLSKKRLGNTVLLQVVELFKKIGGDGEEELLKKLDKFISYGLSFVFGETFTFKSLMNTDGKDVRLEFKIVQGDKTVDIEDACGGGIVEIVSLLMQVFFIVMGKGRFAPFLLLDTALIQLSDSYVLKMSALLHEICHGVGIQVILVTHTNTFGDAADVVYNFTQKEGKTSVERVK